MCMRHVSVSSYTYVDVMAKAVGDNGDGDVFFSENLTHTCT